MAEKQNETKALSQLHAIEAKLDMLLNGGGNAFQKDFAMNVGSPLDERQSLRNVPGINHQPTLEGLVEQIAKEIMETDSIAASIARSMEKVLGANPENGYGESCEPRKQPESINEKLLAALGFLQGVNVRLRRTDARFQNEI